MRGFIFLAAAAAIIAPSLPAQSDADAAHAAIDAGNQAWVEGVKAGDVKRIIATYAEEAVDCSPSGECTRGRLEIERHMTTQLANLGPAHSASVTTWGSVERGNFFYEWGRAEAAFEG